MFYKSPFDDALLMKQVNISPDKDIFLKALELLDHGIFEGHKLLDELIANSNSDALVASALFSLETETKEEFDQRHIHLLINASEQNNPLALYSLGVYFDIGEFFQEDKKQAMKLFKQSAELNMPQAMYVYGVMIYYGTGGAIQDKKLALKYLNDAVSMDSEQAKDFLEFIKEELNLCQH